MKNNQDKALLLLLAAGLLLCTVTAICFPAPSRSEREGRELAPAPAFSFAALLDGSFTAGTDKYLTERFRPRNMLREVRAVCELALGKLEVGGILLGSDETLAARPRETQSALRASTARLSRLREATMTRGKPFCFAPVPWKAEVRGETLPRFFDANPPERTAFWEAFPQAISLYHINTKREWFRTDHHWTTHGAYAAYTALCPSLGVTPMPLEAFEITPVSTSFYGTSDAAAGIPGIPPDTIELYRFAGDTELEVTADGKALSLVGLYDTEKLSTRDKYGVFLGGNYGVLRVNGAKEAPTLLLLKDSFANSVIPFLARHFNIIALDPRYTKLAPAAFLPEADTVLVLMGMQTLGG